MDYQKHYNHLIDRARTRLLETYTEKHHIIPKCMNGSNDVENIVALTPEEHYVAHQLLVKIYPNEPKLVYAAHMMTVGSLNHSRSNKLYGWLRKKFSEAQKENPSSGMLGKKHCEESKMKISIKNKGRVPWNKGKIGLYKHEEEIKQKISKGNKGKQFSKEHRQNLSKSHKAHPSMGMLGKKHREESKQVMSEKAKDRIPWNKGRATPEETKRKQSETQKGKPWSVMRRAAYEAKK